MFKRFLVVTELSDATYEFADCMERLKVLGAEECLLLQHFLVSIDPAVDPSYMTAIVENSLMNQKAMFEKHGYRVTTRMIPGLTKSAIDKIAKEENYEVIVVGARENSMLGELFFGGLTNKVIHQAQVPVLVVRIGGKQGPGTEPSGACAAALTESILFPTDFSDNAAQAFEYLKALVSEGAKKVTLIHIQDQYRIVPYLQERLEEFNRIDRERLRQMQAQLKAQGDVEVDAVLGFGHPSVEILKHIRDNNIQLVVMGSQGKGFVEELFLGGVSHNIVRYATASVLLIPNKRLS